MYKRYGSSLVIAVSLCFASLQGVFVWNGDTSGTFLASVDSAIDITGDVNVDGVIRVFADTANMTINLNPSVARVIKGKNGTTPRLYLQTNPGFSITFNITEDVTFRGTDNGLTDLLVAVVGNGTAAGTVVFNISDDKKVIFTSAGAGAGARVFVDMNSQCDLIFQRANTDSASNVEVVVGAKSSIAYLGQVAGSSNKGTIQFLTGNSNPEGFFILRVQDAGAVLIQVYQLNALITSDFLLSQIDFTTLALGCANFEIENNVGGDGSFGALRVINENAHLTDYRANPFCLDLWYTAGGIQYGFILGANGQLNVLDRAYLDYIGTVNNKTPQPNIPAANVLPSVIELKDDGQIVNFYDLLKSRNPSAFIVDGNVDNQNQIAKIFMQGNSGVYFRSGVDEDGFVNEAGGFIIDPVDMTQGIGEVVFDVEGVVDVQGAGAETGLHVLSLEVTTTGCPVAVYGAGVGQTVLNFPARTFAKTCGVYNRYNRAAFLINNRVNLLTTNIIHDDENHNVVERTTLQRIGYNSEPTYVGGEKHRLCLCNDDVECPTPCQACPRPMFALYNSQILFNTSAAFTGLDIRVPNVCFQELVNDQGCPLFDPIVENDNISYLRFYSNGRCIDDGYGRYVILGTDTGAFSQCGTVLIDNDAHLDVFQDTVCETYGIQKLLLVDDTNSDCITEGLEYTPTLTLQRSVHTIYLGNNSNITVGGDGDPCDGVTPEDLVTTPTLEIAGDFMSFETAGGTTRLPETGGTTGQGAIFVDQNGSFIIDTCLRANMSTMVVKSGNGFVSLPRTQVMFDYRVGITNWRLDLATTTTIVPADAALSDYTLDWGCVKKNCPAYMPYELNCVPNPCECPPITQQNITSLPTVLGSVRQFQVKRSRLGDMVNLLVDGGTINELVFLTGGNSAEGPLALLVLRNFGNVGLNSRHEYVDSTQTSGKLGINGITIVADGNGVITLNEDLYVENVCHIMPGPNMTTDGTQRLIFHASEDRELRVFSGGVLDLSKFQAGQTIEFNGVVRLVFEPGSTLALGGGQIVFTDKAQLQIDPVNNDALMRGTALTDLDPVRVKFVGTGEILVEEAAAIQVFHDTILTIGSDPVCAPDGTNLTFRLIDQGSFNIGTSTEPGGVFEVGNSVPQEVGITFSLIIDGYGASMSLNRQGMVGLGVGIVSKLGIVDPVRAPNNWLVQPISDVDAISIILNRGTINANQIFGGEQDNASLLAIGNTGTYRFTMNPVFIGMQGGSNMIQIPANILSPIPPTVLTTDGFVGNNGEAATEINPGTHYASIIQSAPMIEDDFNRNLISGGSWLTNNITFGPSTGKNLFDFLKVKVNGTLQNGMSTQYAYPMSAIAPVQINSSVLGFVYGTEIRREIWFRILSGFTGDVVSASNSQGHGAVQIKMDNTTGDINVVTEISSRPSAVNVVAGN